MCRKKMPKKNNLTGCKFHYLTVLKPTEKRNSGGSILWKCQCDCGNITYATSTELKSGHKKSCGCLQKKIASKIGQKNLIDLTGQRFGKLVVISKNKSKKTPNGSTVVFWNCKCDCGNSCIISGNSLKTKHAQSCGCIKSLGEQKISKMLNEANIFYEREKIFKNSSFRFDFFVENQYIIEYDGKQHFQDSQWGNHLKTAKETQKRDKEKNNWCKEHNIPIIRIPYTIFNQLTIKDLLLETSSFIV